MNAHPVWRVFAVPKRGNSASEYEDAHAAAGLRFAVADGATETSFAREWAELLVQAYCTKLPTEVTWPAWLAECQRAWQAAVGDRALPWYAEEKRESGAAAAFVGLQLSVAADHGWGWVAQAVGDCCLLHCREGELVASFPLLAAADFDNHPPTLGSKPGDFSADRVTVLTGTALADDVLALASDALAHWLIAQAEKKRSLAPYLDRWATPTATEASFAGWIEERRNGSLRNDDVTLLAIRLP